MALHIAVDVGGTFTDLVAYDAGTGRIRYTKSLTTHARPLDGIMACVDKVGIDLGEAALFRHGTTLVINTLLEMNGARVALVTTQGFRDSLDFGRGSRMEVFNLFYRKPPALVPRDLRFEVDERIDGKGVVLRAPARKEVATVARAIRAAGVSAVAVHFLNAYRNEAHEKQVAQWLAEELPDAFVTTATSLNREWSEYERCSTAVANAYTGEKVGRHVLALEGALAERAFSGQLMLMGSNGGMISPRKASEAPVLLVESGPVGGCLGAGTIGQLLGMDRIIAFDMGGTTAKCALVRDGEFEIQSTYYTEGAGRGIPVRAPVLDIVEVGAGGGSIGWLDHAGRLMVGPKSAGSTPGPAAYGRGGTEPTVTDANLYLGRLNPLNFQGGEMTLDMDATQGALAKVAVPLGYEGEAGCEQLACGMLEIAAIRMGEAIKHITVRRGLDPADFVMFAYGGGGPLHSTELAREVGVPMVVIPPEPGNFSSLGMLLADIRLDEGQSFLRPLNDAALSVARDALADLEAGAARHIKTDFGDLPIRFERFAGIRYVGQHHAVRIPLADEARADALYRRFAATYRERYGHASEAVAELVSIHIVVRAATDKPELNAGQVARDEAGGNRPYGRRQVYYATHQMRIDTPVFERTRLAPGFEAQGPAIIEEYGSTTVIGPTDAFVVGSLGEIRITIGDDPRRKA